MNLSLPTAVSGAACIVPMKMIDLDAVHRSLTEDVFPIGEEDIMDGARRSLERMMAVPRDNWVAPLPQGEGPNVCF